MFRLQGLSTDDKGKRDAGLTSGTCGLEVGSFGGGSQWLKPPASTHDKCKV